MHMVDRQRVQEDIVGSPSPIGNQSICVARQIAVRQHRSFRTARGSRRVENGRQILTTALGDVTIRIHGRSKVFKGAFAVFIQR